jgi:hypothetical protein
MFLSHKDHHQAVNTSIYLIIEITKMVSFWCDWSHYITELPQNDVKNIIK